MFIRQHSPKRKTNKNPLFVVFAIFHVIKTFHHDPYSATNMSTLNVELERNVLCWLQQCMSQPQFTTDPDNVLPP